ncbi:MAG: hypothetical protein OXI33_16570 [Chloroflexota bacterium]|nr:hypothetical protein [Chloroflexota bacterium]
MSHDVPQDPLTLSESQLRAVPYLSAARIFTEAAEDLGMSRETISHWLNDHAFRDVCEQQWDRTAAISTAEIKVLILKTIVSLAERLLSDGPQMPTDTFRLVTVPDLPRAREEREREAHIRFQKLIADFKNRDNCASSAEHRNISRPRNPSSEATPYLVLRSLLPDSRLDE